MPLSVEDKVITYSVTILHNNVHPYFRQIRLSLESGGTAEILFAKQRPTDWLQIGGVEHPMLARLYMTEDEFADVYHIIQSESPVFFTAMKFGGLATGSVHTELGETPGEGDEDHSLEALIRLARRRESGPIAEARREERVGEAPPEST